MLTYNLPAAEYHAHSAVSFHRLMDFDPAAGGSPRLYHLKHLQKAVPHEATDSMELGTAAHALLLEGREAYEEVAVVAPRGMKFNTKDGKAFKEKAEADGKIVLSADKGQLCEEWLKARDSHKDIAPFFTSGKPEVTCRNLDPESGIEMQCRFDWLQLTPRVLPDGTEYQAFFGDLKTTAEELRSLRKIVSKFHYDRNIAWYHWQLCLELDLPPLSPLVDHRLFFCSSALPYGLRPVMISPTSLAAAHQANVTALHLLVECLSNNLWPHVDSDLLVV